MDFQEFDSKKEAIVAVKENSPIKAKFPGMNKALLDCPGGNILSSKD